MRRHLVRLLFTGLLVLGGLVHADQVPKLIGFQGTLRDSVGGLVNGTYNLTFTIYTASSGGTSKWTETQNSVAVTSGALSVTLGSATPIPDSVFNNDTRWLSIKINSFTELTPRIRFLAVGYSLRVNTVNGANGGAISGSTAIGTNNIYSGSDALAAGNSDTASGNYTFVAGYGSKANGEFAAVTGGFANQATGDTAVIAGGGQNVASGDIAFIGGGRSNTAATQGAVVAGGIRNIVANVGANQFSTIAGGSDNVILGNSSTSFIGGGGTDSISWSLYSVLCGGVSNIINDGLGSVLGGGELNVIDDAYYSFLGTGFSNTVSAQYATICGGGGWYFDGSGGHLASGEWSAICGGRDDTVSAYATTIGGGWDNDATDSGAFVGGGFRNRASGKWSSIAGGDSGIASGINSAIGGGKNDTASGKFAMVPGGEMNKASGNYSFAGGRRAKAINLGAFVWADSSANSDFSSTANNQFRVRAAGGTQIYSNSALSAGVTLAAGGGSWASVSDSTLKRNAREVNGTEMLEKLDKLPIKQWSYKSQDPNIEHIGPMAQDFYSVFQVGDNNTTISTIDPAGIALAATKELHQLYKQLAETTESLKTRTAELETVKVQLAELQKTVQQLVQASGGTAASKYGMVDQSTTNAHR